MLAARQDDDYVISVCIKISDQVGNEIIIKYDLSLCLHEPVKIIKDDSCLMIMNYLKSIYSNNNAFEGSI